MTIAKRTAVPISNSPLNSQMCKNSLGKNVEKGGSCRMSERSRLLNQIICIAKALNEHGIILNIDDMSQTFNVFFKFVDTYTIPISKIHPIQPPPQIQEKMKQQNITDFWTYYLHTIKQAYFKRDRNSTLK